MVDDTRTDEQNRSLMERYRQRIADLELLENLHQQSLDNLQAQVDQLHDQNQQLHQERQQLSEHYQRYRDLFDQAPLAYWLLDTSGAVLESNFVACDLLQENRAALAQRPLQLYIDQQHRSAFNLFLAQALPDQLSFLELEIGTRKGPKTPVQLSLVAEQLDQTRLFRLAAVDISQRRRLDEQVRLAATVFEESSEGVMITDAIGNMLHVNPAFSLVTGYLASEVIGLNASMLGSGRHDKGFFIAMWEQLASEGHWQGEIWNKRKNGEIYPEWLKISTIYGEDKKVLNRIGIFKDLGEVHRDGTMHEHFAFYDMLTELPNRILFIERLKHALLRAQRDRKYVAVLYLDLDRFKQVNDSLGHQTGDLLLQDVATRLTHQVRANDTVARLGGDEFAIIVAELDGQDNAQETSQRIACNVCQQLALPFVIGAHEILIGSSVGIAYYPQHGQTYGDLVKHADVAMYQAKTSGGGHFVTFSKDMSAQLQYRSMLEGAVRQALRHNELHLVYQPILDARTHELVGLEVLLRWNGPQGPVSPVEFIPIYEELGLGSELMRWTIRRACQELQSMPFWQQQDLWFSVNLSPHVVSRNHVEWLSDILAEHNMPNRRLVIEIREEDLKCKPEALMQPLHAIRKMGIRVAIDDFGSGYFALGRLREFPVDLLKMDRSFVASLDRDAPDFAVIITLVTLAEQFNKQLLATGVETPQQIQHLLDKGCLTMQGYVFAHPMAAEECIEWFQQNQPPRV